MERIWKEAHEIDREALERVIEKLRRISDAEDRFLRRLLIVVMAIGFPCLVYAVLVLLLS